jgi:hypothetical protein
MTSLKQHIISETCALASRVLQVGVVKLDLTSYDDFGNVIDLKSVRSVVKQLSIIFEGWFDYEYLYYDDYHKHRNRITTNNGKPDQVVIKVSEEFQMENLV